MTTEFLSSCYRAMIDQDQAILRTMSTIPKGEEQRLEDARQVILTGAGDSLAVAEYGAWVMQEVGIHAIAITPTVLNRLSLSPEDLVV